jgi:signal peptidase I
MTTLSQPTAASVATSLVRTHALDECKTALAAEILRAGDSIRLQVLGSSMLPSIWPGDVVSIDKVSVDEIVPGDIVVYERDDRLFVHRLLSKTASSNGIRWETRGDSMPQNDPPFSEGQLLGRVSHILCGDRAIIPKRTRSGLARLLSWMICHIDSARNLALRLHALRKSTGPIPFGLDADQFQLNSYAANEKGG